MAITLSGVANVMLPTIRQIALEFTHYTLWHKMTRLAQLREEIQTNTYSTS